MIANAVIKVFLTNGLNNDSKTTCVELLHENTNNNSSYNYSMVKQLMALDIIKEQRLVRTLFFSLIQSAELIVNNEKQSETFVRKVAKYIKERTLASEGTRNTKEVISELLEAFGWKYLQYNYNENLEAGKISLGRNRFFTNDQNDSEGTLLMIKALFAGIGEYIVGVPVDVEVVLSLSSNNYYEISFSRKKGYVVQEEKIITAVPTEIGNRVIHEEFTINTVFNPIFTREILNSVLFDNLWKVISESYIANSDDSDEIGKEAAKKPSMENISILIMRMTENLTEPEIMNMAEIIGEFFVKLLKPKVTTPLYENLQSTIRDKHAASYLLYFNCKTFCADQLFINRCVFIRGLWIGILSEIFGKSIGIKEILHAGKRDAYCMIELAPKSGE